MTTSFPAVAVHLVDDEAPVRDALEFLFVSHELPVRSYASGQLFLDSLQQASHELSGCIVLDVRMDTAISSAITLLSLPAATRAITSCSRGVNSDSLAPSMSPSAKWERRSASADSASRTRCTRAASPR